MVDLPKFKIGNLEINMLLGGMGVGITGKNHPSAMAETGGGGTIATVALGVSKKYPGRYAKANQDALRDEIRAAKKMSNGVIGVNIMRALTDYKTLVEAAVEENADYIVSGAGLPLDLPGLVGDKKIALIPIVENARVANIISNRWWKYGKVPDAFIVEGPEAGGHLAGQYDKLVNGTAPKLEDLARGVIDFANTNFDNPIPVIVAGGIYIGQDILKYQKLGAAGIQMATRFVTTLECDADDGFKWTYLNAKKEDIKIIKSPVGMPGRAIINSFLEKVMGGEKIDFTCKANCLKTCIPKESPYCIAKALVDAQRGDFKEGFAFAGSNAYKATRENSLDENGNFITVDTLMNRIADEYNSTH